MTVVNITAKTYTDKAEVLRIQEVPLESIIIEDRFRIDMGNIGELSESIEELGFFDPLLIDEDYRLCDGYRRILGLKEQGHTTALCIIIKRPSPLLAMKLEQQSNNIRKEFTWQEKMDIDKAIDDFNRARDPNWTQEKQGKLRRTSQKSVSLNLELAKAAEKFPELREFKTRKEARKALERV